TSLLTPSLLIDFRHTVQLFEAVASFLHAFKVHSGSQNCVYRAANVTVAIRQIRFILLGVETRLEYDFAFKNFHLLLPACSVDPDRRERLQSSLISHHILLCLRLTRLLLPVTEGKEWFSQHGAHDPAG